MQLDAADESDDHPVVGITPGQIGHYGQSASLIVVTITTRPTVLRKPPSGGSQPVAYDSADRLALINGLRVVDQGRLTTVDLPVLVEKTNRLAARLVGE